MGNEAIRIRIKITIRKGQSQMNSPAADIREEIARSGAVSFARFMELALYAPACGYYERPRDIGRRGDFFTSVSVGPVFGGLLAFQFAQWLDEIALRQADASARRPYHPRQPQSQWQLVEAGALGADRPLTKGRASIAAPRCGVPLLFPLGSLR